MCLSFLPPTHPLVLLFISSPLYLRCSSPLSLHPPSPYARPGPPLPPSLSIARNICSLTPPQHAGEGRHGRVGRRVSSGRPSFGVKVERFERRRGSSHAPGAPKNLAHGTNLAGTMVPRLGFGVNIRRYGRCIPGRRWYT